MLGVARGQDKVQFGGLKGRTMRVKAGDVTILPAGTGHQCLGASDDFLVIGACPPNGTYDECTKSEDRKAALRWLESHPLYDWILAAYQNSRLSRRKIAPFIRTHRIDMNEFEPVSYHSYAQFFERRFRPGARKFPAESAAMGAFAERYLAWDHVEAAQEFPVKGRSLDAAQLLGAARGAAPTP